MMKSVLIKSSALLVLVLYVFSFVGISVHTCSCTGSVCIALAIHQHHEHGCAGDAHDHSHHHCCAKCEAEAAEHAAHHCCHNEIYKIALSGDGDHADHLSMSAPELSVAECVTPYIDAPLFRTARSAFRLHAPPHLDARILRMDCVVRI